MTDTSTPAQLQARIEALEIKASFHEDLLETLNLTLYRQQQLIDSLQATVRQLGERMPEAGPPGQHNLHDELPPHY